MVMADDDVSQATVRLPAETMERLRSELAHFNTDSARFQFLVQFYFDYKEVGYPQPTVRIVHDDRAVNQESNESSNESESGTSADE